MTVAVTATRTTPTAQQLSGGLPGTTEGADAGGPGRCAPCTYRLPAGPGGEHLADSGRPAHHPRAVTQHEDQLVDVLRSEGPVFTSRQGNQFSPFSDGS